MSYSRSVRYGLAIKVLKPFIYEDIRDIITCTNTDCDNHGRHLIQKNFCSECGSEIKEMEIITREKTRDITMILDENHEDVLLPNIQHSEASIYFLDDDSCAVSDDEDFYTPLDSNFDLSEHMSEYVQFGEIVNELYEKLSEDHIKVFYGIYNVIW